MTWRDQLIQATWRGVPFFVESHEAELGRRVQVHEYPQRDKPFTEDLGRKTRTFTVEAFVLGADYMALRDSLLAAVERRGVGELEHPYLGQVRATCTGCRLRESTANGGIARFSLSFVETGETVFPQSAADSGAAVKAGRSNAQIMAERECVSRFACAGFPAYVADAAQGVLGGALDAIQTATRAARTVAAQVAAINRAVVQAKQQLISIVYEPASAAQAVLGNVRSLIREVAYGPREALDLARTLFTFGSLLPPVQPTTSNRRQQAANQSALTRLVKVSAVTEACVAASAVEFTSYQEAVAVRAELVDVVDLVLEEAELADELFDSLRQLRAATVADITLRGANLARVVQHTPLVTLPGLVVAYDLFGDAARADELLARNGVAHPLFVPGGQALEVLTNG